jgi:stage V sporulation protein B
MFSFTLPYNKSNNIKGRSMSSSLKKSIIQGTMILTIAGIIARLLGFYNRIFLCNLFGERELGIYQMVLPVYMVVFSLCCQGIQTALTRQIARTNPSDSLSRKRLLISALTLSLTLSLLCLLLIYCASDWISLHILHSTECAQCLRILCFAFPFVTIEGCLTGYFMGIQRSGITAASQLIEQLAKILGVFFLSSYVFTSEPKAYFALYGVVIGEAVSCIYLMITYAYLDIHTPSVSSCRAHTRRARAKLRLWESGCMKELLHDAVPLTTNRLSLTLLQSLESILIPHMLNIYLADGNSALILYGTLTGLVLPCIMFPTTLTSSLAMMLLPAISTQYEAGDFSSLRRIIRKSILFCFGIGLCSTAYLLCFGTWTGTVLFSSATAGELLFQFALLCPFIYLSSCLASIMNGIGRATVNMIFSILCIGVRIGFILWLVPLHGLQGYLIGMMISYILQTVLLLYTIQSDMKRQKSL